MNTAVEFVYAQDSITVVNEFFPRSHEVGAILIVVCFGFSSQHILILELTRSAVP